MTGENDALDLVLTQLGSKFGWYQVKSYVFISIPLLFSAIFTLSYVFTARNLNYRCYIPECDLQNRSYNPRWLSEAVPFKNGEPARCDKYIMRNEAFNESRGQLVCTSSMFNHNITERCDRFVYNSDDVTIMHDFDLMCEENIWKLTLVGTINNIGEFFVQPVTGFISDRYGRKFRMLSGLLISVVIGLSRSLSPNYLSFLFLEFLDTALGSGAFACAFILGMELVSPDKRILSGCIVSSAYALGEVSLALVAMYIGNWRILLRVVYLSGLSLIALFWLTPESLRWMLARGDTARVELALRKAAKLNNVELSEELLRGLNPTEKVPKPTSEVYPISHIFKSRQLLLRLATCSVCWITSAFVFFGLTLNSVAVSGDVHLNFVFVGLVEIPSYVCMYLLADRIGRRLMLCSSLLLAGAACIAFIFISNDISTLKLIAFMTGKFGITIAFTILYVFTAELFPTSLRHSMVGTCSMFARIGSMTAPQTPLLGELFKPLPLLLFGGMCCASGLLGLTLPETLNTILPDTVEEAENIAERSKLLSRKCNTEYVQVNTE